MNLFAHPGDPMPNVRAKNMNTIDEVAGSNWFTNRTTQKPVTVAEVTRGPNTIDGPAPGRWTVIRAENGRRRTRVHRPR